jgi:hypothetical protein
MNLAGPTTSLARLLEREHLLRHGSLGGWSFSPVIATNFSTTPANTVSLFLYRIDVDSSRRHVELPRPQPRSAARFALGLEFRYLLTVWGSSAVAEHSMLGECMECLDRHALVSGDELDPTYAWEEGDALKICLESVPNEDMLRLWDSFNTPYRLSLSYLVRTVRLTPVEKREPPLVDAVVREYVPAIPGHDGLGGMP